MVARRQTPPVPLNWNSQPAWARLRCSTRKCPSCTRPCARVSQFFSKLENSQRDCAKPAVGSFTNSGTPRFSQLGGGRKSASSMAMKGAVEMVRPCAQAPALKPSRSGRRTCSISAPSARNSIATASARAVVSSFESSSNWICSLSLGQSSCATHRSDCSVTKRFVDRRGFATAHGAIRCREAPRARGRACRELRPTGSAR